MPASRQIMYGGVQAVVTSDNTSKVLPANNPNFLGAKWVDFYIYISSISGAPSAASLTAKFQKGIATSTGVEFAVPLWQDFSDYDVAQRCLGGQGWGHQDLTGGGNTYARATDHNPGTIHDSSISGGLTVGYFVTARVEKPFGKMRISLTPSFTGGTSPAYNIVSYYEIGRD